MAASDAQIVADLTISALAETATGSAIYQVTALPTTGAEQRPSGVSTHLTGGLVWQFNAVTATGLELTNLLKVGDRIIVGLDRA